MLLLIGGSHGGDWENYSFLGCNAQTARRFRKIFRFHLQDSTVSFSSPLVSVGFSLELLFDPEDGGDIFLQIFGISPNYTGVTTQKTVLFFFSLFSLMETSSGGRKSFNFFCYDTDSIEN
jgi:hypothetical protein